MIERKTEEEIKDAIRFSVTCFETLNRALVTNIPTDVVSSAQQTLINSIVVWLPYMEQEEILDHFALNVAGYYVAARVILASVSEINSIVQQFTTPTLLH